MFGRSHTPKSSGSQTSSSPKGLEIIQARGQAPSVWFRRSGWGLRICIDSRVPGDAPAAAGDLTQRTRESAVPAPGGRVGEGREKGVVSQVDSGSLQMIRLP